jgi:hypothetical protein
VKEQGKKIVPGHEADDSNDEENYDAEKAAAKIETSAGVSAAILDVLTLALVLPLHDSSPLKRSLGKV